MPEVQLNIPINSKFHSSLNEIDLAMNGVLLNQMRIADPRNSSRKMQADIKSTDWLWNESNVFQVDELTTEEIFNTYLLRKKINDKKGVDISYPILAYLQNDIDTVYWGTGNRYKQWFLDLEVNPDNWEIGDEVIITSMNKYRGMRANITKITSNKEYLLSINNKLITITLPNGKISGVLFKAEDLKQIGKKTAAKYKAKAITGTYTAVILVDNRDEAQYLRDKFILRCADAQIWHKYNSPTLNGAENQVFTVFDIPNLERYPASTDKVKGQGYIYGVAFNINIWGCLTDTPLPQGLIEQIKLNISVERHDRINRIVIS